MCATPSCRKIRGYEERLRAPGAGEFAGKLFERRPVARGEGEVVAVRREDMGEFAADAARGTGDERHTPCAQVVPSAAGGPQGPAGAGAAASA